MFNFHSYLTRIKYLFCWSQCSKEKREKNVLYGSFAPGITHTRDHQILQWIQCLGNTSPDLISSLVKIGLVCWRGRTARHILCSILLVAPKLPNYQTLERFFLELSDTSYMTATRNSVFHLTWRLFAATTSSISMDHFGMETISLGVKPPFLWSVFWVWHLL